MLRRLGLLMLPLAFVVASVCPAAAPGSTVEGAKGEFSYSETAVLEAPATTFWGVIITTLLVMGASTATLLGGGVRNAVMAHRTAEPAATRPAASTETRAEPERAKPTRSSPKNKSKRTFSRRKQSSEQIRHTWNATRRGTQASSKPRRRSGAGCRGVR